MSDTRIRATRSNIFIAVIQKNCGDSVATIDNDAEVTRLQQFRRLNRCRVLTYNRPLLQVCHKFWHRQLLRFCSYGARILVRCRSKRECGFQTGARTTFHCRYPVITSTARGTHKQVSLMPFSSLHYRKLFAESSPAATKVGATAGSNYGLWHQL